MKATGLLAFPITPFTSGLAVDLTGLRQYLEGQLAARRPVGPSGQLSPTAWFVACGTGEFAALGMAEFRSVVRTAVEVVGGSAPVYAGAGGGPQAAREFAAAAQESGADGLLLLPPYLVSAPPSGLVAHIRYVAEGTSLPILVYQRANAVLDPDSALALLDIDNVVGIKDGVGDLDLTARITATVRTSGHPRAADFQFINGLPTAELSAPAYRALGVESYSSAVLAFAPDIALTYYAALVDADTTTRDRLLERFYLPLTKLRQEVPGYAVSLVKAGAQLAGWPAGPLRPPLVDPSPEHLARLEQILNDGRAAR